MNLIKAAITICAVLLIIGCGKNESTAEKQAASAVSTTHDETPANGKETVPTAIITSVHAQWIISDSMPKAEITLLGENLVTNAAVASNSPQMKVERIEPDPVRTQVIVALDMASPAADYELQYQAPGQEPIPFTIHYAGAK